MQKELLTSLLILVLVVLIFVVLVGYFFRWVFLGQPQPLCPPTEAGERQSRGADGAVPALLSCQHEQKELLQDHLVCRKKGWGRGETLLSSCQNCQMNVGPLFQVQETQESCGELRRQKDAKWDLGRTRYGGICFQTLILICVL